LKVLRRINISVSRGIHDSRVSDKQNKGTVIQRVAALTWLFVVLLSLNSYANNDMALIKATKNCDISTVKALLANGANVNAKDIDGKTALMYASAGVTVVKPDYNQVGGGIIVTLKEGCIDVVKALLANGANVNAKDINGWMPLMIASTQTKGHSDIVKALLANGANVNAKTNKGDTALMIASGTGHVDVVKALLGNGANVNAKDIDGNTALKVASKYLRGEYLREVVQLLREAGARE